MTGGGRPSKFSAAIADSLCELIATGNSLVRAIELTKGAPSYTTVINWLDSKPEFLANYTRAREVSGDYDADRIRDVSAKIERGEIEANAGRVVIDALKWSAGKRKPKVYGDKVAIEQSGTVTHSHQINQEALDSMDPADLATLSQAIGAILSKPKAQTVN